MMKHILDLGLQDAAFIAAGTEDFVVLEGSLAGVDIAAEAAVAGVDADLLKAAAVDFAQAGPDDRKRAARARSLGEPSGHSLGAAGSGPQGGEPRGTVPACGTESRGVIQCEGELDKRHACHRIVPPRQILRLLGSG